MWKLNKFLLIVFSIIILVIGVFINLIYIGWLSSDIAFSMISTLILESPNRHILFAITEISMVLAIFAIFSDNPEKKQTRKGQDILLQNDNGKLMIAKDAIENYVNTVVSKFEEAKEVRSKIFLDNENNLIVLVDIKVTESVVIKELTLNIQNRIKESIKNTSDLEVKEVNVRIKNIENNRILEGE